MSQDDWLTLSKAAGLIRDRLGCTPGRAEAILQEARSSGEVRAIQGRGPIYIGTDDGVVDFNARPGAFNGYGSRCPATAENAELSDLDFLGWLNQKYPVEATKGKGGRPPKFSQAAVDAEVKRLMDHHGEFSADDPEWNAQARLCEAICKKFGEAAPSTIDNYIKEPLVRWRERHPKT
jgi:hypothetical protein